jgi:carbon-monoxide dehydrogenase medium subunit
LRAGGASAYLRHGGREAMEVALVGAAAALVLDPGGRVAEARIALAAVAPTCVRAPAAEALLAGAAPDAAALARAADAAVAAAAPIDDHRAPADYRAAMVAVVVRRALHAARARALGEAA